MTDSIRGFTGQYAWLSNFEFVDVFFDGETYPSVEHAYQASKFVDAEVRRKIRTASTGRIARARAELWPVTTPLWGLEKRGILVSLLRHKFFRPEFQERLLATGAAYLDENEAVENEGSTDEGVHLGRIIMQIRGELGGTGVVEPPALVSRDEADPEAGGFDLDMDLGDP